MRKIFLFTVVTCITVASNATIRRVGYAGVPQVSGVDYTSFYAAYQAAVAGDTIYVFPGYSLPGPNWPTYS